MENFVHCHGSVVRLLDSANDLGFLGRVQDDSGFWETRDEVSLRTTVGQWNAMIAAAVGTTKDLLSTPLQAPITRFPNFEHLEAKGRRQKKEG